MIVVLISLKFAISLFVFWWQVFSNAALQQKFCGDAGACEEIFSSRWSKLFGIPLSVYGVAFSYTCLLSVSYGASHGYDFLVYLSIGNAISLICILYLIYNYAFCKVCITYHAANLAAYFTIVYNSDFSTSIKYSDIFSMGITFAVTLLAFGIIAFLNKLLQTMVRRFELVEQATSMRLIGQAAMKSSIGAFSPQFGAKFTVLGKSENDTTITFVLSPECVHCMSALKSIRKERIYGLSADFNFEVFMPVTRAVIDSLKEISGEYAENQSCDFYNGKVNFEVVLPWLVERFSDDRISKKSDIVSIELQNPPILRYPLIAVNGKIIDRELSNVDIWLRLIMNEVSPK